MLADSLNARGSNQILHVATFDCFADAARAATATTPPHLGARVTLMIIAPRHGVSKILIGEMRAVKPPALASKIAAIRTRLISARAWHSARRPNETGTIRALNDCQAGQNHAAKNKKQAASVKSGGGT